MTAHMTASVIPLRQQTPMHPSALDERVIVLDIDQIEPYEHNPRLLRNPMWPEIEASIVASGGLTEILSVTKRPSDDYYIVHQGGNTRLLILKKLHTETDDDRFRQVRVELHPYTNELDLAALHDRENTCRGDLTFIEQAWSKYRQFELYSQDARGKPTIRAFMDFLRGTYGDRTTTESFSRMKYAVEVLYQHIPTCLVHGPMSQRAVRHVIQIRKALGKIWNDREIGSKDDLDETFYGLLARQDKDLALTFVSPNRESARFPDARIEIDWKLLYEDMCHELTILVDVDHQRAGALLAPAFRSRVTPVTRGEEDGEAAEMSVRPVSADLSTDLAEYQPRPLTQPNTSSGTISSVTPKLVQPSSVRELRTKAHDLAHRLASTAGIDDLIKATPTEGYGYRLIDRPSSMMLSSEALACWWALALCSSRPESSPSTDNMGVASIGALAADHLAMWSKLLAVHARLIDQADDLWSNTTIV